MKKNVAIGIFAVMILSIIGLMIYVTASNKEISLRSQVDAQKQVCEAFFDKMWKIVNQKAQVADQYKQAFKEIYPALIEGRYGNEKTGTLMKFIVESNPQFDVSLYKDLMTSIEAERTGFFMEQKRLVDLANEHRITKKTWPASMFIGRRPDIEIKIVSSASTKKIMETGEENDVELFKK